MFDIKCPKCLHEFNLGYWQELVNQIDDEFEYQCPKCNDDLSIKANVSFSFEIIEE